MLTRIKTASLIGVDGYLVTVETDVRRGLPQFRVAGLADTTIKEAFMRIRPAVINSGFEFPSQKVTVNLVPAGKQKEGSHFDLPIALGIVLSGLECEPPEETAYFGEISLDGRINAVHGALPLALGARKEGIRTIMLPWDNAEEVSVLKDVRIIPVRTLEDAVLYTMDPRLQEPYRRREAQEAVRSELDFAQVIGHESVKRALVIAVAGHHGILMMGGPGCGKTMMARRLPTIMPALSYEEQLEITGIYSVAGLVDEQGGIVRERPFRSPHHTITPAGLMGGGSGRIRPGELSLAHDGVLFLDELGEFDQRSIDAMRQPLEDGVVRVCRNTQEIVFPSRSLVVIASNPCKCGYLWDANKVCTCTTAQLEAHRRKLAGPFADRIDLHVRVDPVPREIIEGGKAGLDSASMRAQTEACIAVQQDRYQGTRYTSNGDLDEKGLYRYCTLSNEVKALLDAAYERMHLNMRAYTKVIKIARTIADLEQEEEIGAEHIAEALMYRVEGLE